MTVISIIECWLNENGYDGLYNADGECACRIGDLVSCEEPFGRCLPGYQVPCPENCGEHYFHIQSTPVGLTHSPDEAAKIADREHPAEGG